MTVLEWGGSRSALACLTVALFTLSALAPMAPNASAGPTETRSAGWLVCAYMCADNNIEGDAIADINEMEAAMSSPLVDVVVLIDRYDGVAMGDEESDDTSNGDWTDARILEIAHDDDPETITSTTLSEEGELNMGDPDNLVAFVDWAISTYNRENVLLDLWDHGGGWTGICFDDESNDNLDDVELDSALSEISTAHGNVSLLSMDACVMATMEILYAVWGYCDYLLASQETEPGAGFPWTEILDALADDPSMTPDALASVMVDDYITSYTDGMDDPRDDHDVTMSAFDMGGMDLLFNDFHDLSGYLYDQLTAGDVELAALLEEVRPSFEEFGLNPAEPQYDINLVDLVDVLDTILAETLDTTLADGIGLVLDDIAAVLVDEGHGPRHEDAHGLSIYFPESGLIYDVGYRDTIMSSDLYWVDAIETYYLYEPDTPPRIDLWYTTPYPFNYNEFNYLPIENTEEVFFTVTASDLDGDALTYVWNYAFYDIPTDTWGELTLLEDWNEPIVSYSPEAEAEEVLFLYVTVSDGYLTDECYWIVIVSDNTAPELAWSLPPEGDIEVMPGEYVEFFAEVDDQFETSDPLESGWYVDGVLVTDEYDSFILDDYIYDYEQCTYVVLAYLNLTTSEDDSGVITVELVVEDEEWSVTTTWSVIVLVDTDGDGTPDIRDDDDDDDGQDDVEDDFPLDPAAWLDTDKDGKPDELHGTSTTGLVEDLDDDGDGHLDVDDTFPKDRSAWRDKDGDGKPDELDGTSTTGLIEDKDDDNDGYLDVNDDFPRDPVAWSDTDKDGKPDELNGTSATGLVVDDDDDGDGVLDIDDVFPKDRAASVDTDRDGKPDTLTGVSTTGLVEDTDDDNDGVLDALDAFPRDPTASVDTDRDGKPDTLTGASTTGLVEDTDDDNDGALDGVDAFPKDAAASVDTDGDGKPDALKGASTTGLVQDTDDDNDGVLDGVDAFPRDPAASVDTDRDGKPDTLTGASTTGLVEDTDDDGDGVSDAQDKYPLDPTKSKDAEKKTPGYLAGMTMAMLLAVALLQARRRARGGWAG